MQHDVALVNHDRRQFLRPSDLGQRGARRIVENLGSVFHIAMSRLLMGPWYGDRVAIVDASEGVVWEEISNRRDGWTNILPDVVLDLCVHRSAALNLHHGGKIDDLTRVLEAFEGSLCDLLDGEMLESRDELSRELFRTRLMQSRIRGEATIPKRWADLSWRVPPPSIVVESDDDSLDLDTIAGRLRWQVDDGDWIVLDIAHGSSDQIVFYAREHVRVAIVLDDERPVGMRVTVGRLDCEWGVTVDGPLADATCALEIPVREREEPRTGVVPCYVGSVEIFLPGVRPPEEGDSLEDEPLPLLEEVT